MPIDSRQIKINLSSPDRARLEMLRAALSMNHPEYACATWSECIIFILRNAPIEAWLQEGINRAKEGAEEEPEIDVTTSPDGEVRGPGCSDAGPIARPLKRTKPKEKQT